MFFRKRFIEKSMSPHLKNRQRTKEHEPEVSLEDLLNEMKKDGITFKKVETFEEQYSGPVGPVLSKR
ncbi:hypothetical protein [Bacillus piscicola]|uniref:hypothetical protein n=1 Tax=Bacillus piscicola TaxID=1632684 RepID=UPI001F0991C2|nr:hypothetical protein [Bacillus piscicola]